MPAIRSGVVTIYLAVIVTLKLGHQKNRVLAADPHFFNTNRVLPAYYSSARAEARISSTLLAGDAEVATQNEKLLTAFKNISSTTAPIQQTIAGRLKGVSSVHCTSCPKTPYVQAEDSTAFSSLRLELIKAHILRSLGLKEPPVIQPTISSISLPKPVMEKQIWLASESDIRENEKDRKHQRDDLEQSILFPQYLWGTECYDARDSQNLYFEFDLSGHQELTVADLWAFNPTNISILLEEVVLRSNGCNFVPISSVNDAGTGDAALIYENWSSFRIPPHRISNNKAYTVRLTCVDCSTHEDLLQLYSGETKPFLVVQKVKQRAKRIRRSLACTPTRTRCCRESFVVSFKEIGWSSWVLHPESYDAYVCKGTCAGLAAMSQSPNNHAILRERYLRLFGSQGNFTNIAPCCAASKHNPLTLLYVDTNNNNSVKVETLDDMIVEQCGCV